MSDSLIEQVKRIIGATGAEMAFPSERTKAALDAAIAEADFPALLAHMRAQGKRTAFVLALRRLVLPSIQDNTSRGAEFTLLDATPAQQCAAFDAVFKGELERINETR